MTPSSPKPAATHSRSATFSSAKIDRFGDTVGGWFRDWFVPLTLLLVAPPTVVLLWVVTVHFDGSLAALLGADLATISRLWPWPTWTAAGILAAWVALQALLLVTLPGRRHLGPLTPRGNRPCYRLNGLPAFAVTHVLLYIFAYRLEWFSPTIVYDNFGSLLMTSNIVALIGCVLLYAKGRLRPSTTDASTSKNPVWDYFWGVELHPKLFGIELKQLVNCRIAMMGWSVILLSFAAAQVEQHGQLSNAMLVSVALQIAYIVKFFAWEGGYFHTLDIMHDRFGFYIAWGVLAWLPSVYTLVALYLVGHAGSLSVAGAWSIAALGLAALAVNYSADAQRQRVRATTGDTTVWGRRPEVIPARYTTLDGREHENLLLASGWWGVSRHFHYLPEILLALAWTLPAGFDHALPYFYVAFLTILLFDRSRRDEARCRGKYGPAWHEYCRRVPYRVVPGLY